MRPPMRRENSFSDFISSVKLGYRKSDSYYNIGLLHMFLNDSLAKYYFEKSIVEAPNDKARLQLELTIERIKKK